MCYVKIKINKQKIPFMSQVQKGNKKKLAVADNYYYLMMIVLQSKSHQN